MGANSKIEWTHHTFNPWIGCAKVHEGCTHCYAEAFSKRTGKAKWGPNGTRIKTSESYWKEPLKWDRAAKKAGERYRVFCASLADVFEDWADAVQDHHGEDLPGYATLADVRRDLFRLIGATPNLDWLLLTKRPENIRRMWVPPDGTTVIDGQYNNLYRHNAWLLTSVSNQETANRMVPALLECRNLVPVLGLSAEPLLGPISFEQHFTRTDEYAETWPNRRIDWVIVGGESGHHARPCNIEWVRDIVAQCHIAEVPCFVKQLGADPFRYDTSLPNDGRLDLADKKGGDMEEWPADLRVREFPST